MLGDSVSETTLGGSVTETMHGNSICETMFAKSETMLGDAVSETMLKDSAPGDNQRTRFRDDVGFGREKRLYVVFGIMIVGHSFVKYDFIIFVLPIDACWLLGHGQRLYCVLPMMSCNMLVLCVSKRCIMNGNAIE